MPNLNLTHNGNMNITSASIGSGGTLNVQYEPNTTGDITGWTHNQSDPLVCGETYTIILYPQFSGTVLTENFIVSGYDVAGVQRSDTSVLRQGYDSNLLHYDVEARNNPTRIQINSSSATENYVEINATVVHHNSSNRAGFPMRHTDSSGTRRDIWVYFDIIDPVGPDTGTVASSLTLVVADSITGSSVASAIYAPSSAVVDLSYGSAYPTRATIDPITGEITVLQNGWCTFYVEDRISGLIDAKTVTIYVGDTPGPDTGDTGVTALTISVADEIIENGIAVPIFSPSTAETSFVFTSSDDSIATIDSGGNITVLDNGLVTFCVEETISGMRDCKEVSVRKAVYIDSIEIVVADTVVLSDIATANYTPTAGTVSLVYTSSDPDKAFINPMTGEIVVYESGEVTFCVRDLYTNKSDCKTVNVMGPDNFVQLTYNVTSTSEPTLLFSNNSCCGDHWSDFSEAIYYNGISITPNTKSYTFPETGEQTIYVDFKTYEDSGRTLLNNCIFRDNTKLVKVKFPEDYNAQATGNYTFYGCTNLREADLSCFTEIDYACFYGCTSLSSITIPNVEIIGESSFINTNLKNVYGPNVKTVYQKAFKGLTSLETAVFPSLINLNRWAFQLSRLREFTFPATVETIGADAFDECYSLRNITFQSPTVKSGWNAFGRRPVDNLVNLFNVWVPCGSETAYKNWLSGYAGCGTSVKCRENVNTVTIPVTFYRGDDESDRRRIMSDAPNASDGSSIGTLGVISIKDSNGKEVILEGPYDWKGFGWYSLQTGDTVFNITFDADYMTANGLGNLFAGSNIKSFSLPGSWGGGVCFSGCTQLETLVCQDGLANVSEKMCYHCTKLSSVVLPSGVTSIGNYAFENCTMLDTIVLPNGITSIGNYAFNNAHLSSVVIPNSVTTIGEGAFRGNNSPTIDIGSGIRTIGNNAFPYATSVTIRAVNAPSIAYDAYNPFRSTAIEGTYPIYVQGDKFYTYAIWGVRSSELKERIVPITAPTNAETRLVVTFYNGSSGYITTSVVAPGSRAAFTKATLANGTVVDMSSYRFATGWTTMYFTLANPARLPNAGEIFTYNSNGVYPLIRMVSIPNSVERIYANAFYHQSRIACVSVGTGLTQIDSGAFYHSGESNPSTYYWFFGETQPAYTDNPLRPSTNQMLNYPCGSTYTLGFDANHRRCFNL